MAFSTQKDFLHVAFMNERPEATCVRMEGVKLKTYASSPDERAWSMSKGEQAQYLIDLVACRMYQGDGDGDGFQEHYPGGRGTRGAGAPGAGTSGGPCGAPCGGRGQSGSRSQSRTRDNLNSGVGDDSVIHTALQEMTRLEQLTAEKDDLKSQLEVSQEKLRILKEEKQSINAILNDEHYPEMSCDMERVINQLKGSNKLDKNEENELKKILNDLVNREKAYKVLEAQNSYLKKLVEKLSLRGRLSSIPVEPEKCTDVNYLQCEVNNLRKEVGLLRSFEDKQLDKETISRGSQGTPSNKDAENIAKIIAERNALREKCQNFKAFEGKIVQWKRDAEQLQSLRSEACCAMKKKDEEIQDLHEEIEELQFELKKVEKCCKMKDQEGDTLCESVECLKEENRRLREEICRCSCDLKKITILQSQIQCLTQELCEKNCVIEQYDCQFQQLLGVVEDLQKKAPVDIRGLQDVDSQTYNKDIELLATSTRETLDQISKELETQKDLEAENREQKNKIVKTTFALKESFELFDLEALPGEDCEAQVERLKCLITKMKAEKECLKQRSDELSQSLENQQKTGTGSEGDASELKKTLLAAQSEQAALKNQNDELNKALKECQNKVKAQESQISKLNLKTEGLSSELRSSKADIKQVGKLVQDISDVQDRNENLQSVLGAVDYQKELADLKKQLENEKQKSATCEEQTKQMKAEVEKAKAAEAEALNQASAATALAKEAETKLSDASAAAAAAAEAGAAGAGAAGAGAAEGTGAAEGASAAGGAEGGKQGRKNSKLAQLQKMHEAQRKAERSNYEKEIAGHRLSNEVLQKSLTKISNKITGQRAIELERELRIVLENFVQEICKWRCEKTMRLSKLQEICKKIVDCGIEYLSYKELVYLHQQMSEAASKLRPRNCTSPHARRELKCCKCSGDICQVPMIPKENERILLEKLAILERDILSARENLRKIKQDQDPDSTDTDQMELDTIRANTYRLNRGSRNSSGRPRSTPVHYSIKEEFEVPTKDRCGF